MRSATCVAVLAVLLTACPGPAPAPTPAQPCEGVSCSGHGSCEVVAGAATCLCDRGFHAEAFSCLADDPAAPVCGNDRVESGEDCDAPSTASCTPACRWRCTNASDCEDDEPCSGAKSCIDHSCVAGTLPAEGTACRLASGGTGACASGACRPVASSRCAAGLEEVDGACVGWASAGRLDRPRTDHTATLLADGRVLVVGGRSFDGTAIVPATRVLVYDPAASSFAAVAELPIGRWGHTATLLADGRVLIAGGSTGGLYDGAASAFLFEPRDGTWTRAADLPAPRHFHVAARLADGRVLLVGGLRGSSTTSSAVLFDPVAGTWSATGAMAVRRVHHAATLLADGRVAVIGGNEIGWGCEVGQGEMLHGRLASAEAYDPATGRFAALPDLAEKRCGLAAALLSDGGLLVTGFAGSAERLERDARSWKRIPGASGLVFATLTALGDGTALLAGGAGGPYASGRAVAQVVGVSRVWPVTGPAEGRSAHSATRLSDGSVLLVGGRGLALLEGAERFRSERPE